MPGVPELSPAVQQQAPARLGRGIARGHREFGLEVAQDLLPVGLGRVESALFVGNGCRISNGVAV